MEVQGKISGVLRERVEIGGPGAFDQCETADEVIDKLLGENDPQDVLTRIDAMRELVIERLSNQATIISPATAPQPASDEVAKSLELFRPTRKGRR